MNLTAFEQTQFDSLCQEESKYFNEFQNVSLPLGGLKREDCYELYRMVGCNYYNTNHNTNEIQIVDVGCWTGESSLVLALVAQKFNGIVYSVDWFQGSDKTNLSFAGKYFNIQQIFQDNIKKFEFSKRIKLIKGKSDEVTIKFQDNSLDFVFLDADHRYKKVLSDIDAWYCKVKPGGIIAGHDCEFLLHDGFKTVFNSYADEDMISVLHIGVC